MQQKIKGIPLALEFQNQLETPKRLQLKISKLKMKSLLEESYANCKKIQSNMWLFVKYYFKKLKF